MEICFLAIAFIIIIFLLACKRPLWQAMLGGLVATAVLYRIPAEEIVKRSWNIFSSWSSLSVLIAIYLIAFLQKILEARGQIKLAQKDLDGIFHNRRINTIGASLFIGLLPSAASMLLGCEIVKDATDGYLKPTEQAFTASWLRHIPESALPTYSSILLLLNLSGVDTGIFLAGMIVPLLLLLAIGYLRYLRRIPKEPETERKGSRWYWAGKLFCHLWTLLLIIVLILGLKFSVVVALLVVIALALLIYRIQPKELFSMLAGAVHWPMLVNTLLVLILKEFLSYSGVLQLLPQMMSTLPLPGWLVFALLLFLVTVISGSTASISLVVPLAFAATPGNAALAVYMAGVCHAASQISPTHICVAVAAEYFGVPFGEMIRRTLPMSLLFFLLMTGYYLLLNLIF